LTGGAQPEEVQNAFVSANLFSVLGVTPLLGRAFLPDEDQLGAGRVVVISHGLWQRRWGGDPNLVGRTVALGGHSHAVIGIMPPDFAFPRFPVDAQVWAPLSSDPDPAHRYSPGTRYLNVMVRLKPGVTLAQAQAEMATIIREAQPGVAKAENTHCRHFFAMCLPANFDCGSTNDRWLLGRLRRSRVPGR
jgi:putative ABC transport system permease protein